HGLAMIDFGWRQYDNRLGRWFVVDKLAEFYHSHSPYAYVTNNPVNFIDPNGLYKISLDGNSNSIGGNLRGITTFRVYPKGYARGPSGCGGSSKNSRKMKRFFRKYHGIGRNTNTNTYTPYIWPDDEDLYDFDYYDGDDDVYADEHEHYGNGGGRGNPQGQRKGVGQNGGNWPTPDNGGYLPNFHSTVAFLYHTASKAGVEVGALIYKDENGEIKYWVAPWKDNTQYECDYKALENIPGWENFEYLATIHSHTSLPKNGWEGPSWKDVRYSHLTGLPTIVLGHNNVYMVEPNRIYSHYVIHVEPIQTVPMINPIGRSYNWLTKGVIFNF
ncbi:MAG: hypothetical protein KAT68_15145, partial [Bacteroidales bacterium]|nr:hypothetical protein [Bacteroidales bacterium]